MRREPGYLWGALLGGVTSLGAIGLFSLGKVLAGMPFLPFDIFDWMARHLPGAVIGFVISTMVSLITTFRLGPTASTAKLAEQSIAIVQFIATGIVFGLILTAFARRRPALTIPAGLAGGFLLLVSAVFFEAELGWPSAGAAGSILWLALILGGWGWALGRVVGDRAVPSAEAVPPELASSRRRFLGWLVSGSVGVAALALGEGLSARQRTLPVTGSAPTAPQPVPTEVAITSGAAASPPEAVLENRFQPAVGTRPELTANADFYRIDINTLVPTINLADWKLELDGLVNQPLSLTLDDIRKLPSVSQALTMSCISNEVGGDLIGTTVWTGTLFKNVLAKAGLKPNGQFFNIQAFDGFYESLGIQEAMDERTLLVYAMNGAPLPPEHGYPLRIYIPNHYGMKQPKWINHITVADTLGPGYWVDRGWSKTATPQTTSVIDNVAVNSNDPQTGTVSLGGIAWAGERGIQKVELQMDDGGWISAKLRVPPLSQLTWVQWRADMPYKAGRHTFRVRATDGQGALQTTVDAPPAPDGATGIFTYSADL